MEIRRFAASGHGLPPFPEGTENPEFGPDEAGLSAHIMGSSVPLWLTNLGIDRWGEAWASSGGLVMRFQAELFEGRPLVMRITEADDRFDVDVSDETGGPCVSARVLRHGPPADRTVVSGRTAALPVDATAELLNGLRLAPLRFEFDAGRDLMIVRDIADGATWSDHRWAHPAWLVSSANAVIKRSVDFGWPRVWVNAGTEIDLHGVVCDGETVEVEAAVESLFERGRHRFANVVFALSAAGRRVASVRYALIYGRA